MKHKVDISNRFAIVMAGGRGERFWPVSREKRPKQLIKLLGERSFLQEAVERIRPLVPPHNVFVITNAAQAADVRKQLPRAPLRLFEQGAGLFWFVLQGEEPAVDALDLAGMI